MREKRPLSNLLKEVVSIAIAVVVVYFFLYRRIRLGASFLTLQAYQDKAVMGILLVVSIVVIVASPLLLYNSFRWRKQLREKSSSPTTFASRAR